MAARAGAGLVRPDEPREQGVELRELERGEMSLPGRHGDVEHGALAALPLPLDRRDVRGGERGVGHGLVLATRPCGRQRDRVARCGTNEA